MKLVVRTIDRERVEIHHADPARVIAIVKAFEVADVGDVLHLSLAADVETYILRSSIARIDVEP